MEQHIGDCDSESEHDEVARPSCSVQARHVEEPWCGVVDSHAFRADNILRAYGKVRSKVLQPPPQSVLARLTTQQRAAFGHTQLHELPPELYKHASPWLARFVRLPSSRDPNTRIVCVSALESFYASNLHRRKGTTWPYLGLIVTSRRRVLEDAADAVHCWALLNMGPVCNALVCNQPEREGCVRRLFQHYKQTGGLLATASWTPSAGEGAPPELTQVISENDFVAQYRRLQTLVLELMVDEDSDMPKRFQTAGPATLHSFEGLEVSFPGRGMELVSLEALSLDSRLKSEVVCRLQAAAERLRHGDSTAIAHLRGAIVRARGLGRGTVVGARFALNDARVYGRLLTLPYELVHIRQIWHVLRVYHRTATASASTETICETACSEVRYIERRNIVGRTISLPGLVAAARLRFAGLRGNLADAVTIYQALCIHFKTTDPSGFHFLRRSGRSSGRRLLNEHQEHSASSTLSRARARVWDGKRLRPSWSAADLGFELPDKFKKALAKEYGCQLHWAPADFPRPVWEQLLSAMRACGVASPKH